MKMSNNQNSSPAQMTSTPIVEAVPESTVPVTASGSSAMGVSISSPAQGITVNQGTSNLIDPLMGNQIHTETNITKRQNESVGISNMNTQTTMDRRSLIASRDWLTAAQPGTQIFKDQFPYCLFASPSFPGAFALGIHEYVNSTAVEFTMQVSASPFSVGILQLIWTPSHSSDLNKFGTAADSFSARTTMNPDNAIDCYSMLLNIGEGNTATLTVPLTNLLSILRTSTYRTLWNGTNPQINFTPENFNLWGSIAINVFNKLEGITADEDQNLGVKLWARLIEPQTSLLRPYRDPITLASSNTQGAMMSVAAAVGSALAAAAPSLAVGAATTVVGAAAQGIAHKVGKKCTYYTELGEDPLCVNMALTNDHRSILSLGYDTKDFADTTTDLSDSPAELDFKGIASRRSRIFRVPWEASSTLDRPLLSFPLHPMTGTNLVTGNINNILNVSNIAFSALSFAYWRGSLTYTFEVVGNSYTRGAIMVVYQPKGDTTPVNDAVAATAYPHSVINIAETRKFSLRVPYNSQTAWSRTPLIRPLNGGMQLIAPDTLGTLSIIILNPIRTNTASTLTALDTNVYIHSVDIDYRSPYLNGSIAPTSFIFELPPPEFESDLPMIETISLAPEESNFETEAGNLEVDPLPGAEVFGPGSDPTSSSLMPNSHTDIRQLLTRRTAVASGNLTNEFTLITIPLPNIGLRHPSASGLPASRQYPVPSFYNLLSGCYAYQTGSQVVSIITGNNTGQVVTAVAQIVFNGDENWTSEFTRGLQITATDAANYAAVLENDASLVFNLALNSRREIGIPWYNMVSQLLSGPIFNRSDDDSTAIPTYMPFAFLKIYIQSPVETDYLITQNVGPNFQFSQFLGAPKFILYDPNEINPPPTRSGRVNFPRVTRSLRSIDDGEILETEAGFSSSSDSVFRLPNPPSRPPSRIGRVALPLVQSTASSKVPKLCQMDTIKVLTNVLTCTLCPAKPTSPVAFIRHLQSSHPREYVNIDVPCPFCRKSGLLANWAAHNPDCKMFDKLQCPKCPVIVANGIKLNHHIVNAHPDSAPLDFQNKILTVGSACSQNFETQMFAPHALVQLGQAAEKLTSILPNENIQVSLDHLTTAATCSSASVIEALAGVNNMTQKLSTATGEFANLVPTINEFFDVGTESFKKMNEIFTSLQGAFSAVATPTTDENQILKNRTRIFASTARAIRDKDWEPIFTEIFLEMFDRFTLVDPILMTVGLKAILMLIDPTSRMHSILNSTILARSSLFVEKLIPDSWKDMFGTVFQSAEDDHITFGKAILLLFSFGGVVLSGLQTPTAFFRDFAKNFSFLNLGRSATSLSVLVESINQLKKWIQERFFGRSIWEGYDWLLKNRETIGAFQADYFEFLEYPLNKILNSSLLRSRAIKISETAKLIAGNLAKIRLGSNEISNLQKQAEFFIQLAKQSRQVPPGKIRVRPTVVTFQGDSQCGKTFLASTALPHYINQLMRWPQEPVFMVSSATEDFMSGYSQQMITMIDDLLQMKEGKDLTGFVNMIGNAPYRVNMAALEEKGTQFLSEVVVVTMNQPHPKVDKFVSHPPAIYNRLYDHYFHVVPKPAFNKNGRLDIVKIRERGIVDPDDYLDFYRQRYTDEVRIPAVENPLAGEKLSFFEIVSLVVQSIRDEEITVEMHAEESPAPTFAEFPDTHLPDHWDTQFQAPARYATRAAKILTIVRNLAKIYQGSTYVVPQDQTFKDIQYLIQEDYSDNILMGLDWNYIFAQTCYGKTLYLHESQDAAHLLAQTTGLPTRFWHKIHMCDPHVIRYVKISLGASGSGNPAYDFIWKSWRKMSQTYTSWCSSYPILMHVLKWYAISFAVNMAVLGGAAAYNWWTTSPLEVPNETEDREEIQKRKDQEDMASLLFPQGTQASWYNAGSPSSGARGKVKVARPTGIKGQAPRVAPTQTQSDIPPLFPIIRKNTVRLSSCGFSIRAIGWKKDIILLNRHFAQTIPDGATVTMERWTPNTATSRLETFQLKYNVANTAFFIYTDDRPIDLVMWRTGWKTGSFKDISNHWIRESDLDRVTGKNGYRVSDVITNFSNFAYTDMEIPFDRASMSPIVIPLAIVARGVGSPGICGSPWVVTSPRYFGTMGKICGIHAFGNEEIVGAIPMTIEGLESTELVLPGTSFQPSQVTFQMAVDEDADTQLVFHDFHGRVGPRDAFVQPRRTELQPSPIFNEVCDVTHEPAVLSNRDPRLTNPADFDVDLCRKTDRKSSWFNKESEVTMAVNAIIDDLTVLPINLVPRLLTLDEAINGVDGPPFMAETGLEMRNSPGYPWNKLSNGKGKFPYFEERPQEDGERLKYDMKDPTLIARVNERMTLAMQGRIPDNSIWLDCMKDELRPKAKCASGATRIINAPPLDLMIAMNVLFGAFRIFFMDPDHVGLPLESALGVDPRTVWPDYGILYRQAMSLFGVDFSKFDSSQLAEFYRQITKIINAWYRMFQVDKTHIEQECLARETLAFEIGHTLHLFGATLYTDDHGLPSGVPGGFTTIFNIMVNMMLARITYIRTGLHVSTYRTHTRNIFLGDDGLHAVMRSEDPRINEALLKYNRIELARVASEIGMTVTMPDKISALTPFDTFEEISFLKSSFLDNVIPGYYLPGMDKKTIGNLLNWYRPRKNPDQFRTNVQEALKFAAPHGKAYYNELLSDLRNNGKMQVLYPGNELQALLQPFETVFYSTYLPFGLDAPETTPLFDFPFDN
ncbi:polyprotein [Ampivirus A1]|uniref:Genome polyprotein n=1 Tax=Ampivirus A1 TaxID=1661395 RepID=A0A0G3BEP0_9PICO|nr:polyprotein [Ampivirus A1]AKJ23343.1 polyprotein [Ampivirus A1]